MLSIYTYFLPDLRALCLNYVTPYMFCYDFDYLQLYAT